MLINKTGITEGFYKAAIDRLIIKYWKDPSFEPMDCFSIN